jgi:hypothetical protein
MELGLDDGSWARSPAKTLAESEAPAAPTRTGAVGLLPLRPKHRWTLRRYPVTGSRGRLRPWLWSDPAPERAVELRWSLRRRIRTWDGRGLLTTDRRGWRRPRVATSTDNAHENPVRWQGPPPRFLDCGVSSRFPNIWAAVSQNTGRAVPVKCWAASKTKAAELAQLRPRNRSEHRNHPHREGEPCCHQRHRNRPVRTRQSSPRG